MRRPFLLVIVAVLAATACDRPERRAREEYAAAARALSDLVHFPGGTMISTAAGAEAAEARYTALATTDSVAAYYRRMLMSKGYGIERETDEAGVHTIYSRREHRPIWVRISANAGGPGVTWTVIGVYSDSTADSTATTADSTR